MVRPHCFRLVMPGARERRRPWRLATHPRRSCRTGRSRPWRWSPAGSYRRRGRHGSLAISRRSPLASILSNKQLPDTVSDVVGGLALQEGLVGDPEDLLELANEQGLGEQLAALLSLVLVEELLDEVPVDVPLTGRLRSSARYLGVRHSVSRADPHWLTPAHTGQECTSEMSRTYRKDAGKNAVHTCRKL